MKSMPNFLSALRIVTALALIVTEKQFLFLLLYLTGGLTDILDGFIARKFQVQTPFGAKLDSLGDFIFWLVVLILLSLRTNFFSFWVLWGTLIIGLMRLLNFLITRLKFHEWGMLHSLGNKAAGLSLFFLCLAAFLVDSVEWYFLAVVFGIAFFSVVEETYILLQSTRYNPNPKGFFSSSA